MAELYLIRHAQAGQIGGEYDQLSELGHHQASLLGAHLASLGLQFDRFASGDLRRQVETLDPLRLELGHRGRAERMPGLNECDFQNLAEAYFLAHEKPADFQADRRVFFRTLRRALLAWSRDALPREYLTETWDQFVGRVEAALSALCDPAKGQRVLAVSSGGAISRVMAQVLGLTPEVSISLNLQIKNSGYSRFIFNGKAIYLHSFNAAPHLEIPERLDLVTYS